MNIVKQENVTVSNAVLVSGLALTEADQYVEAYLLRYGSIKRNLLIDDPTSKFHRNAIVEFAQCTAMQNLGPLLPLTFVCPSDLNVTFHIHPLDIMCPQADTSEVTKGYLEELQAIASASGKSFQDVLQEELAKIHQVSASEKEPAESQGESYCNVGDGFLSPGGSNPPRLSDEKLELKSPVGENTSTATPLQSEPSGAIPATLVSPGISASILDTPTVQRVVVEHIVKANEAASSQQALIRLRAFSGKIPRPGNEPDFDTWRASVDLLMTDPSISDLHRTRKILDSLLPPAADIVKHVSPKSLPAVYLELLESVYGSVEDGDELLAKFMSTLQNHGEKPSTYLHRLQVLLSTAIRRGGISESERDSCLLKQFCRGCWDNGLITDLQLEKRKSNPPSFAELVVLIRTEEDKHASKEERMRKHLGLNKHCPAPSKFRMSTHQISAHPCDPLDVDHAGATLLKQVCELQAQVSSLQKHSGQKDKTVQAKPDEVSALKKAVTELQAQVSAMKTAATAKKKNDVEVAEIADLKRQIADLKVQISAPEMHRNCSEKFPQSRDYHKHKLPESGATEWSRNGQMPDSRPRPGYCFRCGEDGHLASSCGNAPDPSKVAEKRQKLRERQAQWDSHHAAAMKPLN